MFEQVLVHEQYGQVTGGLWSFVPGAYEVLVHADADQRRRYLEPSLRGERFGAYAVTEPNAGSDARTLETTAVRDGADWVINGEKWFVTGPDNTDFMVVQAMVVEGDERRPTLFFVDYDAPGVTHEGRSGLHAHVRRSPPAVRCSRTSACRMRRGSAGSARRTTSPTSGS